MDNSKSFIIEPTKNIPVIYEADICVVGGSCTGVFAAVRAARLGARVVIVECQNSFGGVATNGLVCVWHSFNDKEGKKQIISGLSEEVMGRLDDIDHKIVESDTSHLFNPTELKIELDKILKEEGVKIYLHTYYSGVSWNENRIDAIFVQNKNGRGAIKARFFIDATGDGDLCRDLGIDSYTNDNIQPPSAAYIMQGTGHSLRTDPMENMSDIVTAMINKYGKEFDIEPDWGWDTFIPGLEGVKFRADTHVFNKMCADADQLTEAEISGREKMRKAVRIMRKYGDPKETYALVAACSYIGIRDTYHYKTKYKANYISLLTGEKYEDNILNGTYNIDVHDQENGISAMWFDGTYTTTRVDGTVVHGNWRRKLGISSDIPIPTFYCLPFRCLVGEKIENLIAVGRMINADTASFGALRVMVNLNQMGEAAGVAAYLAVDQDQAIQNVDEIQVARTLSRGGSANLG